MNTTKSWIAEGGRIRLTIDGLSYGYYRKRTGPWGGFKAVDKSNGYQDATFEKEADARGWLLQKAGVEV